MKEEMNKSGPDFPVAHPASAPGKAFGHSSGNYARRVLFVVLISALVLLAWRLSDVFLLLFGAIIIAVALRAGAAPLERYLRVPARLAVGIVVVLTFAAIGVGSWLIGDRLVEQAANLQQRLPAALNALIAWANSHPLGMNALTVWEGAKAGDVPWAKMANVATQTFGAVGSAGLMIVVGVYLAADPGLYRRGFVLLIPPIYRPQIDAALLSSGHALSRWLLGQSISMLFVGFATAIGLGLLGMPLALSLGVIAGVLAFIPFFGPIASGILAVLLAFMAGPTQALYVTILCVLIQQVEGNLLMPFVQRWAVELPPVLGITAAVIFGLLFGLSGIIFATPLMVVAMVLIRKLYVEGILESSAKD
jgi:predicted PurR-regulated permease PerM